jgi:hypothetical protein
MTVTLRHTRTGLIALAAAGIFAAGTVGQRANEIYSGDDEQEVEPIAGPASLAAGESG